MLLTTKHPLPSTCLDEPTSFTMANKLPEWCEAMSQELNVLAKKALGFLFLLALVKILLDANEFLKSNRMLMVPLNITKPACG
jgi:hypothetical protein